MSSEIGFEVHLNLPYDQSVEKVVAALKAEGFGVLTRIDVKATMKEKLGADFRSYVILGACNPPLAHRALSANSEVGLMLPCNVTVEELPDESSLVRIVNPIMMMTIGKLGLDSTVVEVAQTAFRKLENVARSLE